jgi:hypothetical protein
MFNPQPKPDKTQKKPKKRIKPVADKRKNLNEEYKVIRDLWIKDKVCKRCGNINVQLHHGAGRNGSINGTPLLIYVPYFVALCAQCHRYIEDNPDYAKENGYSFTRTNL